MKRLIANDDFTVISRVREFVRTRYPDMYVTEVVKEVFDAMRSEGFYKTLKLDKFPGQVGDVYHVDYDDTTWYVKFMVEDSEVKVRVLSCKWNGYPY